MALRRSGQHPSFQPFNKSATAGLLIIDNSVSSATAGPHHEFRKVHVIWLSLGPFCWWHIMIGATGYGTGTQHIAAFEALRREVGLPAAKCAASATEQKTPPEWSHPRADLNGSKRDPHQQHLPDYQVRLSQEGGPPLLAKATWGGILSDIWNDVESMGQLSCRQPGING